MSPAADSNQQMTPNLERTACSEYNDALELGLGAKHKDQTTADWIIAWHPILHTNPKSNTTP